MSLPSQSRRRCAPRPRFRTVSDGAVALWKARHYDAKLNRLPDLSGNGIHLALGTGGNAPLRLQYFGRPDVYFPGTAGNYLSTTKYIPTGTWRVEGAIRADDYTPGSTNALGGVYTSTGNQRSWFFYIDATGALGLALSSDGASGTLQQIISDALLPIGDGSASVGGANVNLAAGTIDFQYSTDNGQTWQALGTQRAFTPLTLFDSSAGLVLGAISAGTGAFYTGRIAWFRLYQTGVQVRGFNAALCAEPYATVADEVSGTWTLNRSASARKLAVVVRDIWQLGSDDFFEAANHPLLNFGQSAYTMCAFVRRYGTPAATQTVMRKNSGAARWDFSFQSSGNVVAFINDGSSGITAAVARPADGVMELVASVRNRSAATLSAYAGSAVASSADALTGSLTNASVFRVGSETISITTCLDGEFLGGGIFREALSAASLTRFKSELRA